MSRNVDYILTSHGISPTLARTRILDICMSSDLPLQVADVASHIGNKAHLATIYRTLEKYVQLGILERIDFQEGKFRYEYAHKHHHHAVCESCGKVEDVEDTQTEINAIEARVSQESGFVVTRHTLELFGLCNKCRKKGIT